MMITLQTVFLLAMLSATAATVRAEVVVTASPSNIMMLYDARSPSMPDNIHLRPDGGILEMYSDGRAPVSQRSDTVFKVDAPPGAVLESAVLNLHVAMAQPIMSGPSLFVFAYLDDDGGVEIKDFEGPSTYVGSSGTLGTLGDSSTRVDVLVSIDVTDFMRSAYDDRAPFVGFIMGAAGAVFVWGIGDSATAPTLVSTFDRGFVPEPASVVMLATAALAVGSALRARGRAAVPGEDV